MQWVLNLSTNTKLLVVNFPKTHLTLFQLSSNVSVLFIKLTASHSDDTVITFLNIFGFYYIFRSGYVQILLHFHNTTTLLGATGSSSFLFVFVSWPCNVSCTTFLFLGFIKYSVTVCGALCDSMRSVVSDTGRRQQSYCTTVTTILRSRHGVPHPEVPESLSSAPACGVGSERVWVDLASSRPVCQPQLQQCATVSTQTPLCLSSSSSSSELNPSTAWGDSMEAQSAVFFSRFSMFTVIFHLEREESKISMWLVQVSHGEERLQPGQEDSLSVQHPTSNVESNSKCHFPDIFNISGTALMCVRQTKSRYSQEFSIGGGRLSWLKTVKCKDLDSNQ